MAKKTKTPPVIAKSLPPVKGTAKVVKDAKKSK